MRTCFPFLAERKTILETGFPILIYRGARALSKVLIKLMIYHKCKYSVMIHIAEADIIGYILTLRINATTKNI